MDQQCYRSAEADERWCKLGTLNWPAGLIVLEHYPEALNFDLTWSTIFSNQFKKFAFNLPWPVVKRIILTK